MSTLLFKRLFTDSQLLVAACFVVAYDFLQIYLRYLLSLTACVCVCVSLLCVCECVCQVLAFLQVGSRC